MQANQKPVLLAVFIATIVLLVGMYVSVQAYPEAQEPATANDIAAELVGMVNIPTAEDIASAVNVPSANSDTVDKLCELTEGCEFWTGNQHDLLALNNEDAEEDFFDAMVVLTGIDEDYLEVENSNNIDLIDYQVRAYTEDDRDDENWEIKAFVKVRYYDSDEADAFNHEDAEYAYLVITSVLDEGDYDELSIEEVSRNFEFD